MLYVYALVFGSVLGLVIGGKLKNVLEVSFNKIGLFIVPLVLMIMYRILGYSVSGPWHYLGIVLHVASLILVSFFVYLNREHIGLCIGWIGLVLNSIAVLFNGGKMPVNSEMARELGISSLLESGKDIRHVLSNSNTKLQILSDNFPMPKYFTTFKTAELWSIGDIFLVVAVIVLVAGVVCKTPGWASNGVDRLAYSCAKGLQIKAKEPHSRRFAYYYSYQGTFGAIFKGFFLYIFARSLGCVQPAFVIMVVFAALRFTAGGYHMETYNKCLAAGLTLFLAFAMTSQYAHPYISSLQLSILVFIVFAFGGGVILRYAPRDNVFKPIVREERFKLFKKISTALVGVIFLIVLLSISHDMKSVAMAASSAVLLEAFTLTPAGYKFFDAIKDLGARKMVA